MNFYTVLKRGAFGTPLMTVSLEPMLLRGPSWGLSGASGLANNDVACTWKAQIAPIGDFINDCDPT